MYLMNKVGTFTFALLLSAIATPVMAAEVRFNEGALAGQGYPFSESVRAGDLLFLAGQIGNLPDGTLPAGGIEAESDQVLKNITAALAGQGLSLADVVKCTVFLADISEWAQFNVVYKQHFKAPFPARSAMGVNGLAMGARVEVECIAAFPG